MTDLLHDVDEALRREKVEKLWKENGPYILAGAVMLVIFTGIFTAYNNWKTGQNAAQTAAILKAMQAPDPAAGLADAAKSLTGDHKAMARIQLAALKAQSGKPDEAIALLDAVAADSSLPAMWRDLATLWSVRAAWGNGALAADKARDLFNRLRPITEKNNLWHLYAQLQAAMIAGDSLNDPKTARDLLRDILSDAGATPSLKERARALQGLYLQASDQSKDGESDSAVPKG